MLNLEKLIISDSCNIREALKAMDSGGLGFIAILSFNEKVVGILTDGDFRRAILNGISLEENILKIANTNYLFIQQEAEESKIVNIFKNSKILHLPVLESGKLVNILFRKDFYIDLDNTSFPGLKLPVVIMAGGKGTRLAPFTNILPKPLIPIGDKTIIEIILSEYKKYSISDFYITINHKAKLIKAFFEDLFTDSSITFIEENQPLGTGGALKLLEGKIHGTFIVSNCDIIIKEDYSKIYRFHTDNKFDLTIVGSLKHYLIPYGVCELNENGELMKIREKPEYDFLVNTGMYILESDTLKIIPGNKIYNITQLIEDIKTKGGKVGVYPVSDKSWIDIGQWDEYRNAIKNWSMLQHNPDEL
jgi:dTDP-glucose pyrophosphorylase